MGGCVTIIAMENEPKDELEDYKNDPLLSGLNNLDEESFKKILERLDEKAKKSKGSKLDENQGNSSEAH